MARKTRQQQAKAFFVNMVRLHKKEARCPGCKKAARVNEGTMEPMICARHQEKRHELAFGRRRM